MINGIAGITPVMPFSLIAEPPKGYMSPCGDRRLAGVEARLRLPLPYFPEKNQKSDKCVISPSGFSDQTLFSFKGKSVFQDPLLRDPP